MDISTENMTPEQVIQRAQNDASFALAFAVDNQPDLMVSTLNEFDVQNVSDPESALLALKWLRVNDFDKLKEVLDSVPYDSSINNYTGNMPIAPSSNLNQKSFDIGSILAIVGAVLPIVGPLLGGGSDSLTEAQKFEIEQERLRQEAEAKRKQTQAFIIGGVVLMLIVVGLIYASNKNKSK